MKLGKVDVGFAIKGEIVKELDFIVEPLRDCVVNVVLSLINKVAGVASRVQRLCNKSSGET